MPCACALTAAAADAGSVAPSAFISSFFCACSASQAMFFSASLALTMTTWFLSICPVSASASVMFALSANSMYAMPLLRGVFLS